MTAWLERDCQSYADLMGNSTFTYNFGVPPYGGKIQGADEFLAACEKPAGETFPGNITSLAVSVSSTTVLTATGNMCGMHYALGYVASSVSGKPCGWLFDATSEWVTNEAGAPAGGFAVQDTGGSQEFYECASV